jgi:hypothetical protein
VSALVQNGLGQANLTFQGTTFGQFENTVGDLFFTNNAAAGNLIFRVNGSEGMRLASTSRNLLLGTNTDNNFRLDIAASGSSGTLRAYDQTAITGVTQAIVRAGAAQGATNLQTWQNSGGSAVSYVGNEGAFRVSATFYAVLNSAGSLAEAVYGVGIQLASGRLASWSSTTDAAAAKDLSLSRAGASNLRIGDGAANANGDISYRNWFGTGVLFAGLGTPANGTFTYCSDCTIANPCAGSGTGALAKRLNGAWVCN